ncbi:DNA-3-methyladenine glycosylase I [Deinococcus pimensis]|uniref:DNA-3-methyladenine glycosylase I n=1 Tax=Deinococcus pimensis TaxID=309888 RepID=UPI0005EB30CE|nr:DNA-3-methyladenine glycosylase I [Deinococcus pimensis]
MSESYCRAVREGRLPDVHRAYHDEQYGFPLREDHELFERLVLEINQAGLSWTTILRKQEAFRAAYADFRPACVAAFGEADEARLLTDVGIIRNRLKIRAAVENARRILVLIGRHGSFAAWLDHHHPQDPDSWVRLMRRTFVFMGPEIVREFLVSTGYLPGAHEHDCPAQARIVDLQPAWTKAASAERSP